MAKNSSVITRTFLESIFFKLALITSDKTNFIQNDKRDNNAILMYKTDKKNEAVNAGAQMLVDLKQIVGEVETKFNDSQKYL